MMKRKLDVEFKPSAPFEKAIKIPKPHRCPFCKAVPTVAGGAEVDSSDERTFITQSVGLLIFSTDTISAEIDYHVAVKCPKCHARGPNQPTALAAIIAWNKVF